MQLTKHEHIGASQLIRRVSPTMRVISALVVTCAWASWAPPGRAATPAAASAEDQEVVAAVVEDLATNRGRGSPIDGIFSPDPLTA